MNSWIRASVDPENGLGIIHGHNLPPIQIQLIGRIILTAPNRLIYSVRLEDPLQLWWSSPIQFVLNMRGLIEPHTLYIQAEN